MKKKNIVIAIVSAILIMALTACGNHTDSPSVTDTPPNHQNSSVNLIGNTAGNIRNGGVVAGQEDWIYYNNTNGLYKIKVDGTERQQVSLDYANGINVVGDYIYYEKKSGGSKNGYQRGLYKLNLTTEKEENTEPPFLLDINSGAQIIVVEEWVYYSPAGYNADEGLFKIKIDGTNKEKLYSSGHVPSSINIQEDWIYFVDRNSSRNSCIYRIKTDGTSLEPLFEAISEKTDTFDAIKTIIVADDWIYYHNSHEGVDDGKGFYQIKTDGTDKQLIYATSKASNTFNMSENWIYYVITAGDEAGLYKVKIDGNGNERIGNAVNNISILGNWIYYINETGSNTGLYKIKIDGTENQRVE